MRLTIEGLQPDKTYYVQLRTNDGKDVSDWSRKFKLVTVEGENIPQAPVLNFWIPKDSSFHAGWNPVTQDTALTPVKVERYEVELFANSITKIVSVAPTTGSEILYELSAQKNAKYFNGLQDTVRIRVRAVTPADKKSDWSLPLTANASAPDMPTNFVATPITEGIDLTWDMDTTGEVRKYELYMGMTAGFTPSVGNMIFSGYADKASYYTSTFSEHFFKLFAVNAFGLKSLPATASATPISPYGADSTPPSTPTGLAVTVSRTGESALANLTWTFDAAAAGNDDIQSFVVKWRKVGTSVYFMDYAEKAARSLSVALPQPYADYEFQIASVDSVANYSNFSSVVTLSSSIPGAPPQTVGVTSTTGLDNIQLSWTPSTHDDVKYGGYYEVQIATNSAFTTGLLTYQTGNTNISVSGLTPDTVYYYRVRAVDVTALQGAYSTTGSNTTSGFEPSPITDGLPPTSSPAATASAGIGTIYVNWSPITNADLVKYEIHMSTTAGFVPTLGGATKVAETPGTVVTLMKDAAGAALSYSSTYYIRIIAKDADTTSGNAPAPGTVSVGVSPRKAGTGDIITIIADQIATGALGAATITVSAGGSIQSNNYVAGTTGYKISDTVVDIRSGVVAFNTLATTTLTTTGLSIGAGGRITVDSTGAIQSNNWASLSTGWKISATGIELNDANSKVKATAITGDTVSGRILTVTSGGSISSANYNPGTSTGWTINDTGFTMYNGTIYGSSVTTNQLTSIATDASTGQPLFSINAGGFAQFAGARVIGNTVLGSASSTVHYIQSYNYSPGSTGWKIDATGAAEMNSLRVGSAGAGMLLRWSATYGMIEWNNSSGTVYQYNSGGNIQFDNIGRLKVSNAGGIGGHFEAERDIYVGRDLYIGTGTIKPSIGTAVNFGAGLNFSGSVGITMSGLNVNLQNGGLLNATTVDLVGAGNTVNVANPNGGTSYTGIPNVRWTNGGLSNGGDLVWTSNANSSRRYKKKIETLEVDSDKVLSIRPVSYELKQQPIDRPEGYKFIGFIAEELEDAGLGGWLEYDDQGRPDAIDYARWCVAQQVVLQKQQKQIKELTKRIERLES